MAESKNVSVQVGPGLSGMLFLVFLVLKLMGYIDWSWWWVTAPLWVGLAAVLAVLLLIMAGAGLVALAALILSVILDAISRLRRRRNRA